MRGKTKGFAHKKSTRFSSGFTLIEVMLVLAISSLLAIILLNSYNDLNRRSQFRDGIERIVTKLEATRNEANSTINTNADPGNDETRVNFSRVVNFFVDASGKSQMRIFKLSADNAEGQPSNVQINVDAGGNQNINAPEVTNLEWGIKFEPPPASNYNYIIFSRSLDDGKLNTFVYRLNDPAQLGNQGVVSFTVGSTNDTDTATLKFTSADGSLHATVKIKGDTGEITKTYDD